MPALSWPYAFKYHISPKQQSALICGVFRAAVVPTEEVPARPCPLGLLPQKASAFLLYSEYSFNSRGK